MKCDELKKYTNPTYGSTYYDIDEVDAAIAELKDKIQMHDFFWEGCGFAKRGLKNAIAVSEAFDRLEAENAELKKKLMPCLNGDCILTCEVVEKYGKENAELKAENDRLKCELDLWRDGNIIREETLNEIESLKASHYAEMVDAGMRERRLRRALFIALSYEAKYKKYWYCELLEQEGIKILSDNKKAKKYNAIMKICQKTERKCRAKAEQYK